MKYSVCIILALAAVVAAVEVAPRKIEKRGILGGIGLPLGYSGLPLGYGIGAPLAAPVIGSPLIASSYGLGGLPISPYGAYGLPLSYGLGGIPLGGIW